MDKKLANKAYSKMKRSMGIKGDATPGSLITAKNANPMLGAMKRKKKTKVMKEGSKKEEAMDKKENVKAKKRSSGIKLSGKFEGKSNVLGHGGRAAQLKAKGVPGGVIGNLARAAHAAPGEANFHGKKKISKKFCGK